MADGRTSRCPGVEASAKWNERGVMPWLPGRSRRASGAPRWRDEERELGRAGCRWAVLVRQPGPARRDGGIGRGGRRRRAGSHHLSGASTRARGSPAAPGRDRRRANPLRALWSVPEAGSWPVCRSAGIGKGRGNAQGRAQPWRGAGARARPWRGTGSGRAWRAGPREAVGGARPGPAAARPGEAAADAASHSP